ncbi:MAG TPA: tetratricopeptide repeat protein [Thermoanaerobaculia bacterium]|nr:tetratricopeptide repeat protein [Thermoanaerobaculia bacterium]
MTRDNVFFAACGLVLGLTIGALVIGPRLARSKLAGNSGIAETAGTPAESAAPSAPVSNSANAGNMEQMDAVRRQLQSLKETLEKEPRNFEALVQLGNMYQDAQKQPQAIEYYERALAVREDANVRTDLGICYKQTGRLDKSLAAFHQASLEARGEWQPQFNEAVVLAELRRFDEARTIADRLALSRPSDPEVQRLEQALVKVAKP